MLDPAAIPDLMGRAAVVVGGGTAFARVRFAVVVGVASAGAVVVSAAVVVVVDDGAEVLDPHATPGGQVDAGLDGEDLAGLDGAAGTDADRRRRFVHVDADAVAGAVAGIAAGPIGSLAGAIGGAVAGAAAGSGAITPPASGPVEKAGEDPPASGSASPDPEQQPVP